MTSRQFIDFLEAKFAEYGVEKVIPDQDIIIQHARRLLEQDADSDGSRPGFRDDLARHSDLMSLAVPR